MHGIDEQQGQGRIGRYAIGGEIGRGGMAVVYRAYDAELQRPVALKLLWPSLAGQPGFAARLRHEAISAARLRHPNIAQLYELGQDGDTPFLALEFVPGSSLRQLLEAGPLPHARALAILDQIAGALEYAHALGVVHRDVKPGNIIVGPDDHATLIDFGLAELADDPQGTGDAEALGTPHYLAPEQARGLGADARSDQYALAAVAYELLTGVPPFHSRPVTAIVHAQIYEAPAPPSERDPSLPAGVDAALLRALAKAPHERFPAPGLFVAALRAALAPPVPPPAARRRYACAALAVALVLLAAFALAATGSLRRAGNRLPQRVVWAHPTDLIGGPAPLPAGDTLVVGTLDGSLLGLRASTGELRWNRGGGTLTLGAPAYGGGLVYVGADEAVLALSPDSGGVIWRTPVVGRVTEAPAVSDQRLIVVTAKGYIYVLRPENGQVAWSRPLADGARRAVAQGDWIVLSAGPSLFALDARSGVVVWEFTAASTISAAPALSGEQVLVGTERGVLHALRLSDGGEQLRVQARAALAAAPLVADSRIYIADLSGRLSALNAESGRELWHVDADGAITGTPLLAGGSLLFGAGDGALYVVDARSGRLAERLPLGRGDAGGPAQAGGLLFLRAEQVYALQQP